MSKTTYEALVELRDALRELKEVFLRELTLSFLDVVSFFTTRFRKSPQRIRWIETRGCMADDYRTIEGTVVREYLKPSSIDFGYKDEVFLEIELDNGDALHFPKRAFNRTADGTLEYRVIYY